MPSDYLSIICSCIIMILNSINACKINSEIEGICILKSSIIDSIPFCYKYLPDYICVPYYHPIWPDWTNTTIDLAIEKNIVTYIQKEFLSEIANLYDMALINNRGCLDAYISYMCKMNFHSCDSTTNTSKDLCQSVCLTFVKKCQTYKALCEKLPVDNCEK